MKTIYMVKKDANKTYSEDNWILMSPKEFRVFRQNTDCTGRYFVQLDVCEFGEDRIIAECEKKEAQRYHAELVERMRNIQARKNRDIIYSYPIGFPCSYYDFLVPGDNCLCVELGRFFNRRRRCRNLCRTERIRHYDNRRQLYARLPFQRRR